MFQPLAKFPIKRKTVHVKKKNKQNTPPPLKKPRQKVNKHNNLTNTTKQTKTKKITHFRYAIN